jgi:hypothetical protein
MFANGSQQRDAVLAAPIMRAGAKPDRSLEFEHVLTVWEVKDSVWYRQTPRRYGTGVSAVSARHSRGIH